MDLSALWSHERARLSMQSDDVAASSSGGVHPSRSTIGAAALHLGGGAFDVSDSIAEEQDHSSHHHSPHHQHHHQPQHHHQQHHGLGSMNSASHAQHHVQQPITTATVAAAAPTTSKRRSTVFPKRDIIFRRLVDESVRPTVHAVATVQNFFDCNEFAMEYADRAPKRFYAAPSATSSSSNGTGGGTSSSTTLATVSTSASTMTTGAAGSGSGGADAVLASPQRREKRASVMATSTPRASGIAARGHATSISSTNGSATASSALDVSSSTTAAAIAMPKTSFLSRKNGRKKLPLEFSSARGAFRPYVGDMFSTRGDYIDGMLYMSRMKRSHQLTFGDLVGRGGANARRIFGVSGGVGDTIDLVRSEGGRLVLKDAVSDALSSSASSAIPSDSVSSLTTTTGAPTTSIASTAAKRKSLPGASTSTGGSEVDCVQTQQRRRCALTLSNWSSNPENAVLMVHEGVVEALIVLCSSADDSITRLHCVTALMNLSHIVELRSEIVRQGAVKTIAEIVDDSEDATVRTACAVTLCNLCCLDGGEEVLVADGAVSALSVLIAEHPKVALLCRSALFNLTCVREPYPKIESVLKLFLTLTTSRGGSGSANAPGSVSGPASSLPSSSLATASTEDCDEITAKALCNLSNFKRIRLRLMEEGVVSVVTTLIHVRTPDIQEMLAYVLRNLSAMRACRSEMVAKGCMATLVALTAVTSAVAAKLLIASTLLNLSKEPGNRLRMVFEGLLLLVNELCRGPAGYSSGDALRTVCARTLYNTSCNADTRVKLVERDGVSILSALSRRTSDSDAKKMCTLALCNLLGVQQAAADIMNAGAITALIQLSMAPDQPLETKRLFAKALHELCEHSETRDAVTRAGVIPALLYLSSVGHDESSSASDATTDDANGGADAALVSGIRARCTAALACLAADDSLTVHVCNVQVVRCVTAILVAERTHVAIERFCCSCLSLLGRDEECAQLMVDEGAVTVVLATCMATQDVETKACCCHVLASMSCHTSCCLALVRMGVIAVLATLAKLKYDRGIQRCCAITLAHLSAAPSIRDVLVTVNIVAILALLSNSYSEESQRDCATVLCNLSCVPGHEAHLVREGAIGVLMMISMVRAVSSATKDTCARALFNLLNAETIKAMVHDGLVKVLPAFAGLESSAGGAGASSDVVTMLFMKLVEHPVGRNALCGERAALRALFTLMERTSTSTSSVVGVVDAAASQSTQQCFENLLCELVYYDNSRLPSVNAGIIDALHTIAMRSRSDATDPTATALPTCLAKRLALILFTLSKFDDTRLAVASSASLATLTLFLKRHAPTPACASGECVVYAVATFCSLAWHDTTRSRLEHPEVSGILVKLLTPDSDTVAGAPSASVSPPPLSLNYYPTPAIKTAVLTLCCLSHSAELLEAMLRDGVVDALFGLVSTDAPQRCDGNDELVHDRDFAALVCILFRQLSHVPAFSAAMVGARDSRVVPLLCALTALVAPSDPDSSLDCADALCSAAFVAVKEATTTLALSPARTMASSAMSTTQCGAMACASLVSPSVVTMIDALLSDAQLPETRWRCTASVYALSCVPELRNRLVALGCTRILVAEASRSESSANRSILQCCAGALCNLTLGASSSLSLTAAAPPSGSTSGDAGAGVLAATMVDQGAVPALLALSKLEDMDVREHCTLALTNLSSQSPKVEVGAVSALLSLSLHAGGSSADGGAASHSVIRAPPHHMQPGSAASTATMRALCRPPRVCGDRHKQFARVPDFAMTIERMGEQHVGERKFETDLVASTPPPPHLPTIPMELHVIDVSSSIGGQHGAGTVSEAEELVPQSASNGGDADVGDARFVAAVKAFAKVDPSESRLLGGGGDTDDGDADNSNPQCDASTTLAASGDDARLESQDTGSGRDGSGGGNNDGSSDDPDGSGEQGETLGQLRNGGALLKGGSGGYALLPLSRVVVRKTQTALAARKFKDIRARQVAGGGTGGGNNSDSGATKGSNDLAGAGSTGSAGTLAAVLRGGSMNRNLLKSSKSMRAVAPLDATKSFDDLLTPQQPQQQQQVMSERDSAAARNEAAALLDARASIAAAAAAARLYGAPASCSSGSATASRSIGGNGAPKRVKASHSSNRTRKRADRAGMVGSAASKTHAPAPSTTRDRKRDAAKMRSAITKYLPAASPSGSEDDALNDQDDDDDSSSSSALHSIVESSERSLALEGVREQAKKFGLWS